jgi:hypothetical protein
LPDALAFGLSFLLSLVDPEESDLEARLREELRVLEVWPRVLDEPVVLDRLWEPDPFVLRARDDEFVLRARVDELELRDRGFDEEP